MEQEGGFPLVAVAISKNKSSQNALKWTIDNLITKGQTLILIHVNAHGSGSQQYDPSNGYKGAVEPHMKELFLPFRCFCTRKDINCKDVVVEDHDVEKAIIEFVSHAAIEKLVVGAPSRNGLMRFRGSDISTNISKGAPDFCTVYVVSKGKVLSTRNSVRPAPAVSPLRAQIQNQANIKPDPIDHQHELGVGVKGGMTPKALCLHDESIKSPFTRGIHGKSYADYSQTETDISFVSSGRPSIDRAFLPRLSNHSNGYEHGFEPAALSPMRCVDSYYQGNEFSSNSGASSNASWSSQNMDDVEAEMKRLRLELKQTMEMYNTACQEALMANQKALDLDRWKREEEHKLEEARLAEESALALVEREKAKCKAAMEAAHAQQKIAELEAQKRINAEMQALKEAENKKNVMKTFVPTVRYRRYTIEEIEAATKHFAESLKIGEGGYGPVYRCYLDHTPVAIKVLRPDAAHGRTQFQREVEVLSCIRHPHMVLLLGACPEYGCLVYEYMSNGNLEDRLFRRRNTAPIPWQHRFRIAAEIATGLLFLHQTKPEPLVHRDLKPGNILLDQNYVSKIGDVGLARLIPPSVANSVAQYRMTSADGTFCYMDPEYQKTGMLGVKSDIYSLGIMLLQIITAKPAMGLAHHVSGAIENGTFLELLDPTVADWPIEEAMKFAEISLKCAELLRKDRPDLATEVLPELNRLRSLGEEDMKYSMLQDTTAGKQSLGNLLAGDSNVAREIGGRYDEAEP